jgi:hypothetical protein
VQAAEREKARRMVEQMRAKEREQAEKMRQQVRHPAAGGMLL